MTRFHRRLLPLLGLTLPALLAAQTPPNTGQLLRETQPKAVPAAPAPSTVPLKVAPAPAAPTETGGTLVVVRTITITGNTVIPTATLHALVADGEGKSLSLTQLEALAARITQAYQKKGYLISRAYLPAQDISNGSVTIAVQEGRLGQVRVENTSRVTTATAASFFKPLKPGEVLTTGALEDPLLRLADTPGVAARSTLAPGTAPGTADLIITTTPTPLLGGHVSVDNYGSESTGSARLSGLVTVASPFHLGDELTVQGTTSLDSGQHLYYGRVGYDVLLNGRGTRLGFAYARLDYGLGQNFSALDATGTADVASLILSHPIIRTRSFSLQGVATYDYKILKDEIATAGTHNDRDLNNGAAGFTGTLLDSWLGGGVTSGSLLVGISHVGFTDTAAETADAASARTQGTTGKLMGTFERRQRLGATTTLRLAASGQQANGNLDSAEKFSLGGPDSVRAYPQGEASGDDGYVVTVELQQALPFGRTFGDWQAVAFYDGGQVRINQDPFAPGSNGRALSGAGVGLRWAYLGHWSARTDAAWRMDGGAPTTSNGSEPRIWASLGYQF